jgi:ParB-like nuclease domain
MGILANMVKPSKAARHKLRGVTHRRLPRGLMERIVWRPLATLKPFPGNPRRHPEVQIAGLMKSIRRVWTVPILVDEAGTILAGHGRLEAARRLGMPEVPTITLAGLSSAEKRAVLIADNRLPEGAAWDFDVLRQHFQDLIEVDFDVELSGFTTGEVDLLLDSQRPPQDPADDLTSLALQGPAVSQPGDLWELGPHRLLCGDARQPADYKRLLGGDKAQMVVTDPPYNVRIDGHAMGRGKIRHREFMQASGEMSEGIFYGLPRRLHPVCRSTQSGRSDPLHFYGLASLTRITDSC